MKLPRRKFLHLAAGAAALPALPRIAWAQAYPSRPVRIVVGLPPGGGADIIGAPDRSMALGAARPAIRHREPSGSRQQHRAPRRSCARPQTATRCCMVGTVNAINATLYDKLNFNFIRDIAPVATIYCVPNVMAGASVGSPPKPSQSLSPMPRVTLARSTWRQRATGSRDAYVRRAIQNDGRR